MSLSLEELKSSNNELKEIVNNVWDGIAIVDKNSNFVYVNSAFSPILGYSKDELLKLKFNSLMFEDYKNSFNELLQNATMSRYSNQTQVVCKRKDNQKVYLQIIASLMLNKQFFVLNAKDVTQQISDNKIMDKYVLSSHTDLDDNITKVSLAFSALSGYAKDDLIDKKQFEVIFKNNDKNLLTELLEDVKQGKEWSGKLSCTKKDDSLFWVDLKAKPIYNKYGDVIGLIYLMFDVTNELVLSSQKKELATQVGLAQDEIKQKDKILVQQSKMAIMAETLQMVSHQWRQPLSIISIQAQKLELQYSMSQEPSVDDVMNVLNNIQTTALKLSNTIEEFQNYTTLKNAKKDIQPAYIVDKAIEMFKQDESSLDINCIKELSSNIETFKTFEKELTTILFNILTNSKEAIFKNEVNNGTIIVKDYVENNYIYFEVIDNGKGIKDEVLDRIFEPYYSTKDSQHGVGLGLYTCKIIIENHLNGDIWAENFDQGAKFTIKLPLN